MKKYFILIPAAIVFILYTRNFVFSKPIVKPNPMSFVYHSPIDQVRKNVITMFSNSKFDGLDFQVGYNAPERAINKITDNENGNHFFINWFGWNSSGRDSKIYYNWWGKLKLIPSYHIILDTVSNGQTKITIQSFPKVKAGIDFSLNHLLPYITSRKVNVRPSTIEEYEIIRMIGERTGEKGMPPIEDNDN